MAGPNEPTAPNELRASVLDAALQLGLIRDDHFADWIFDERVIAPETAVVKPPVELEAERKSDMKSGALQEGGRGLSASNSASSSTTSLDAQVRQLEEAYAALATTRLTRAATRKATIKNAGGRIGPSHQVSQSEVLSFTRQDAPIAGSSSTLARSATFSSRSPNPLQIDSAKSNAPFITVTPARSATTQEEDPELSYVSTIWGKELLQSYDIDLSSAPPTPVSNSPFSKQMPLPSASLTNTSFTSSESSLHTPSKQKLFPPATQPNSQPPREVNIPSPLVNLPSEPDTTPNLPPTPPLVVKKNTPNSPTSSYKAPSPSSTEIRFVESSNWQPPLSSPPLTPYSAASPDSPTLPWLRGSPGYPPPPLPQSSVNPSIPPSKSTAASPIDQPTNKTSFRSNIFSSSSTSSSKSTNPPSRQPSLLSRLSFKRKSKNSTTSSDSPSLEQQQQYSVKDLPPIPPSSSTPSPFNRLASNKSLSSPPPKTNNPRIPIVISHVSMDPSVTPSATASPTSLAPSPTSPAPKLQQRGRISPFPVKPIRKQPLSPASTAPASPAPASPTSPAP